MGRLFEFIFFVVIAYFVFKFLNRLFSSFSAKYKKTPQKQYHPEERQTENKDIKWDAETVDYEEIETKENEKK